MRCRTGNQCSSLRTGVICSRLPVFVICRAAAFCTDWSFCSRLPADDTYAATSCLCGVPQESVLGPLLFVAYTCPVVSITAQFGVSLHQYADDTQLYIALSKSGISTSVDKLQNCLSTVHLWFSQNGLVINPEKIVGGASVNITGSKSISITADRCKCRWLCGAAHRHRQNSGSNNRSTLDI